MTTNANKIPLIEMYGPVMQGEGVLIGRPTFFLRFGACDFFCTYCDSMHAVDDKEIEKRKTVLSAKQIAMDFLARRGNCPMVTLSGGNPVLWDLTELVNIVQEAGVAVAVETQGSVFKPWLGLCEYVTVSPKGPGMIADWEARIGDLLRFLVQLERARGRRQTTVLKVPIFGRADLDYCRRLRVELAQYSQLRRRPLPALYLSLGNFRVNTEKGLGVLPNLSFNRNELLLAYENLFNTVMTDYPELADCAILPQMHVLIHGSELGR